MGQNLLLRKVVCETGIVKARSCQHALLIAAFGCIQLHSTAFWQVWWIFGCAIAAQPIKYRAKGTKKPGQRPGFFQLHYLA